MTIIATILCPGTNCGEAVTPSHLRVRMMCPHCGHRLTGTTLSLIAQAQAWLDAASAMEQRLKQAEAERDALAARLARLCVHESPGPVAPFASGTEDVRLCPDCAAYVDRLGEPVRCGCVGETL